LKFSKARIISKQNLELQVRKEREKGKSTLKTGTGTGLVSRGLREYFLLECGVQKIIGSPSSFLIVTKDANVVPAWG
jgi:hypothetical protein